MAGDNTIQGYEAEPHDVEALFQQLCGDLMEEKDWLIRYSRLTPEQTLYAALVLRIKQARGEALAAGVAAVQAQSAEAGNPIGLVEARRRVADAANIGTQQRVAQIIAAQ